jgi:hypothetical protein
MILPKPKKGVLPMYHTTLPAGKRHKIILMSLARKKEGSTALGRHLLLLSTLTKRRAPRASKVFKANSVWTFKLKKPAQK